MKVILKEDMDNLGETGDIVDVKPGYARNFLLPRGLAYVASDANLERLEAEKQRAEEVAKRDYLEARRRASQIEDKVLTFFVNAGEEGKLFGSVTSADIAEKLNQEAGLDFEFDKRLILLDEPIKELGTHFVPIKLHADASLDIEVSVVSADG